MAPEKSPIMKKSNKKSQTLQKHLMSHEKEKTSKSTSIHLKSH